MNYPTEESRLRFTLVREVDDWYISAVTDAKFARLREAPGRQAAGAMVDPAEAAATGTRGSRAHRDDDVPGRVGGCCPTRASTPPWRDSTTPSARRRVLADGTDETDGSEPARQPFWRRLVQRLRPRQNSQQVTAGELNRSLQNIREAITRYTVNNDNMPPDETLVRDWPSLRQLVADHGRRRRQIPDDESAAGLRFVRYTRDAEGFVLQLEFLSPQKGFTHVEITPYRVIHTQ